MCPRVTCWIVLLTVGLPTLAVSGCGRAQTQLTLDHELAKASLNTFLSTWRAGKPPTALQECEPPVVANDEDWSAGKRLVSYTVLDDPFSDGVNLHVNTVLTVAPKRGRPRKQEVAFVVGTSPAVTIFRK